MSGRKGRNKILAILVTLVMVIGMVPLSALAAPGDEYTVTFIDWDNTVLDEQTVIEGSAAIAPTVPPRNGYDFDDWDVDFSAVYDDLIIRAMYTPIVYTITYDLGDGTNDTLNPTTYTVEETPLWFYPPTWANYAFVGWTTGFNIPGGTTGDVTLTAVWVQNQNGRVEITDGLNTVILGRTTNGNGQGQYFIIVLNHDGQIIDATTNLDGPSGTEEFTFEGGGYTLDVSIKGNNLMGADVTITYFPVRYEPGTWGSFTPETHTGLVIGDPTPGFPIDYDVPSVPGWTFAGWSPTWSPVVTGSVTYVAQWNANDYTIVYDPGTHGTWLAGDETYTANHGDPTPAFGGDTSTDHDPGWTFVGWDVDPIPSTVTGSVTYTAQWTQNGYTIVYDPGAHGTWQAGDETYTANYGDTTPAFSGNTSTDHDPGWTFTGWLPSVENTVTGSVTYVAQWSEVVEYNITYILNGGTNDPGNPNKYTEEDDEIVLKNPTRVGYNFIEWTPTDTIPAGSTGDKEFTAIWSDAIIYTITYVLNGGTNHDDNPATYTVESSTIMLGAPSREGSTFNRWTPTDSIPAGSTGNKTFTASWTTTGGGGGGGGPTVITDNPPPQAETVEEEETIEEEEVPLAELDIENHFAYIIGYEDDTVRPQNYITRAEVSTIFFRLLTLESREEIWSKTNDFPDVDANSWYNNAISTLTNGGILQGYPDGTFRPKATITRAELATIAVRFQYNGDISSFPAGLDSFTDISGHWAENYIKLASELGYVSGYPDGSFRPNAPISRAEVATLLNNVLNRHVESKEDMKDGMKTWVDNPESAWYYFAIQEATNSHYFDRKDDGAHEVWTEIRENPEWSLLEKPNANPHDVTY